MAKKPAGLIYGVDDKPPLSASVLLGLQHVFVMTSGWVLVVVIVTTIGGSWISYLRVRRISWRISLRLFSWSSSAPISTKTASYRLLISRHVCPPVVEK